MKKFYGIFLSVKNLLYFIIDDDSVPPEKSIRVVENRDIIFLIMKNTPLPSGTQIYFLSSAEIIASENTHENYLNIHAVTLIRFNGTKCILDLSNGNVKSAKEFFDQKILNEGEDSLWG